MSRRLRVLLLSEVYPPEPVVGAFRVRKLAHAFRSRGHDVTVIVTLAGSGNTPEDPEVDVRVTGARPGPRELLLLVWKKIVWWQKPSTVPEQGTTAATSVQASASSGGLRNLLLSLLHLPDDRQGLIPPMLASVRQAAREHSFDMVYASAPSFSVLVAATIAARRLGIPLILEFRDPWYMNGGGRITHQHRFTKWLDGRLERWCVAQAKTIVTVTEGAAKYFRERANADQLVQVGLNGIDRLEAARLTSAPRERLRIVYSGSLYAPRDPRPLIASIARVAGNMRLAPPEFVFVGQCHEYDGQRLRDYAASLGVGEFFREVDWLPQQESFAMINEADLLLLPAQRWIDQIPNKLFDYLGSRVPILCLAEAGSDPDHLLQQVGGHFVSHSELPDELDLVTERALQAAASGSTRGDHAVLHTLTVSTQFTSLVSRIEQQYSATHDQPAELPHIMSAT